MITINSGKCYVGYSHNPEQRLKGHWKDDKLIGRALRKHGIRSLEILSWHPSQEEASDEEIVQIAARGVKHPGGYNLTDGGDGVVGYEWTDEDRKRKSMQTKEIWSDPKYRALLSRAQNKRWEDPEQRKHISETLKEYFKDPEFRARNRQIQKEIWKDPQLRELKRIAAVRQGKDPKVTAKRKVSQQQRWKDPKAADAKALASAITKKQWRARTPQQKAEHMRKMHEGKARAKAKREAEKK